MSPARYFNQRLLNFNRYFASDTAHALYELYHLLLSINFTMHKIKPGTLTTGTVKSNLKE